MTLANIDDMRARARRKLPKLFFDYIDGAAFSETTARRNRSDFDGLVLRQRVLRDVSTRSLATTVLGRPVAMPVALGPVGFSGLFAAQGEIQAARAAHAAGLPYCLSSFAIADLAQLRAATEGPLWLQLYVLKDRDLAARMIRDALDCGVETLCVTVDTPVGGLREKDVRNGFRSATKVTPRMALMLATKPGWCARILRRGIPQIGSLAGLPGYGSNALEQAARLAGHIDAAMTWEDIAWIRELWPHKLLLKGILAPEDAELARQVGADGVIVSNHGGRQLDGTVSTIAALPEVVSAVGTEMTVLMDGGIRRGSDVLKALALGADGVLLGRAYAYGLAAAGQAGVAQVLEMIGTEMDVQLAQMGLCDLTALKGSGQTYITRAAQART